ncbi:MAG: aminotransferase class V-fold PLP-dependent enzyme [Nonlabens sp.]|uniref:aminotransferase class V-fold PLP-dependent enzyme n=1 Tax=Nonlabens sp. TaxID=1888209 RepID=UPI003EFA69F4
MHKIRSQFPILENYTYLNTANHGLISQDLIDYRINEMNKMRDTASLYTNKRNVFIDEVRATIARFMDAPFENTAVIPNFSTGFNILMEGINKKAKFLLLEGDYPSVNWPVETRGFDCVYAAIDQNMEENILKACEQHQPDFFCFSVVQYISGIKMDLEFIKQLKQQFPHMILIGDLTQYVGCEEFRFRESGLDIILASCYKWLNAGDGNGFICVKDQVKEFIKPSRIGYRSTRNVMDAVPEFIGRFEPGHQDMTAFGSLKFTMETVEKIGLDHIQKELNHWSQLAKTEFQNRNLLHNDVVQREQHSTIFNIKGDQELYDRLNKSHIITSLRGDGIRVSFSYFNSQEDLDQLLKTLDA